MTRVADAARHVRLTNSVFFATTVNATRRDTTSATHHAGNASSMTSARANGRTGRTSLSPTPETTDTEKEHSIQVRAPAGSTGPLKLPGNTA